MSEVPKVSVMMLTYYHEKYVSKALDSILSQKTDFPYEILVGDDASGDGTQEILKEYASKYPDIFRLTLRGKNLGATRNGADILSKARGKYIAKLEGDDYWIDLGKLQKQVDFLDAHEEFIGCSHKCVTVDENGTPDYTYSPHWTKVKKVFKLADFLAGEYAPGQTGTIMHRNVITDYSPLYAVHSMVGDKTMMLMLLTRGDFYGFNEVMSAYRLVIDKGNGKNWFSIHHANPYWQYDAFMRPVKLTEYARGLGIKEELGSKRDYHYMSLVESLIKEPDIDRVKQLAEMTVRSRRPLHCLGLAVKQLILR